MREFVREYRLSKNGANFIEDLNGSMVCVEYQVDNILKRDIAVNKFDDMLNRTFQVSFLTQIFDENTWKFLETYSATVSDAHKVNELGQIDDENGQKTEAQFFIDNFGPYFFPLFIQTIKNKKDIQTL